MEYGKIIKTVDFRCVSYSSKYGRNAFVAGAPDPAGEAYSAPPDRLPGFKGPTSKGRGGEGMEGGMGAKVEEREDAGRGKGRGGREV